MSKKQRPPMPRPDRLVDIEVDFSSGYWPSAPALSPEGLQRTIRRASNVWVRPGGKIEVADGLLEISSTNVGARLFAADIQRASIAGGLVGDRLPFAGFLRYQNAVLFFLSENTNAQVYLNETAVTGLTTSATAGRLRVAVPDGVGGYNVFDAGFDPPALFQSNVNETVIDAATEGVIGTRIMSGIVGATIAPWRSKTDAVGASSTVIYNSIRPPAVAGSGGAISIVLPSMVSGQDGWIFCGTRGGDQSGEIRVVRRIYTQPRGTFSATNSNDILTGVNTRWTRDLGRSDLVTIEGADYNILSIFSDTSVRIFPAFAGSTSSGKVMTIKVAVGNWYDSELGALVESGVVKPPRAAGILQYAGRVFLWGVPDPTDPNPTQPTGNAIIATLDSNPEHVSDVLAIATASGSDLVNVLPGDGVMYLMTTTSLEVVSFTSNPAVPYIIRIAAEPGFMAATNGVVYKDWFYGFTDRPLRTRAGDNIDVQFAAPVWDEMRTWNSARVIVAVDPENEAVLYIQDNGSTTVVIPYMAQQGVWNAPINLSARILDTQVVNGILYVTYLSGGNIRVNQWEGGAGIGGDRYIASQYYDANFLNRNRIKNLVVTGKAGALRVYSAQPDAAVPDVSNPAVGELFTLSDTDKSEPEIFTNIEGRAFAFRCDFASDDGNLDKIIARGLPKTERR